MNILSFPVSFNPLQPGAFNHVELGSDAHKAQEIAAFWLTNKGERPIYQDYGVNDPTFGESGDARFAADFAIFYGDKIMLTLIDIVQKENAIADINIEFE